ncbi:MAG TPA: TIGR01777 family protein [Bacteroidetes bacterium]|nr:TIGR01777 family protein [Bacteroidota bacterium]
MAYKRLIVLAGGSGYLGRLLISSLSDRYEFLVLGRAYAKASAGKPAVTPVEAGEGAEYLKYPDKPEDLAPALEGAFALINLAGKSVDCRYTAKNKKEIMDSRVKTTTYLGKAVNACAMPPEVWVNLSSATIYPDSQELQTELSATPGGNFSEDVCLAWEKAFQDAHEHRTRKVVLRCGLVFGRSGGAFPVLKKLASFCLAGKQGNGRQFMSVLHENDFVRAMEFVLNERCMGAYNLCIPRPIQNIDFMRLLASYPPKLPQIDQPRWLVKLGALLIRTEAELVLKSRCVIPERLLNDGFYFEFENLKDILDDLNQPYFQSAEKSSASPRTGNFSLASCSSE